MKYLHPLVALFILAAASAMALELVEKERTNAESKSRYFNKLIYEKSPYLLDHADNPVDWYPWGEEAFEKARREDKPIFLSIGYSSCHWCHVMELESFMDFQVAGLINTLFVPVLVDREERPDIDNVYGLASELTSGRRGWPQTVFLTPDLKPLYATSYMPKSSRFGQPGLIETALFLGEAWASRRDELLSTAQKVESAMQKAAAGVDGEALDGELVEQAFGGLVETFDTRNAGFGDAPKFPTSHKLMFLLQYWKRTGSREALAMAVYTLDAMRRGGIYDHVGYGFHRYSTDASWLVPHFEKMLYDQAMLAMVYVEGFQATGIDRFAETAREIFDYVLENLGDRRGGFYTSEDADTLGEEGRFYLWGEQELKDALTPREYQIARAVYNIEETGNFIDPMLGQPIFLNILHVTRSSEALAAELGMSPEVMGRKLRTIRWKLNEARNERPRPDLDDKILTDWNGLMIAALAEGARALDSARYQRRAVQTANFILREMRTEDGRLLHRYRGGEAAIQANADDYAFLIWGLLELYETTLRVKYLEEALALQNRMIEYYWDDQGGGFFFTAKDAEELIIRQKEIRDGAYPSGNAVAMHNLLKLGRITANTGYEELAARVGRPESERMESRLTLYTHLMSALDFATGPSYELVIAGNTGARDTRDMVKAVHHRDLPHKVLVFRPTEVKTPVIVHLAEYTRYQEDIEGAAAAYVCKNFVCRAPTTDIDQMIEWLNEP